MNNSVNSFPPINLNSIPLTYDDNKTFPENDKIEIWELKNKKFQLTIKADKNQVVETQLLKGLQIDLSKIFSD
ncbi:hypothetical protein H8E88_13535 [candidate division KSB1 bacterium]|nr:hypothetical protein [candidate division KSB1 bacterium]